MRFFLPLAPAFLKELPAFGAAWRDVISASHHICNAMRRNFSIKLIGLCLIQIEGLNFSFDKFSNPFRVFDPKETSGKNRKILATTCRVVSCRLIDQRRASN